MASAGALRNGGSARTSSRRDSVHVTLQRPHGWSAQQPGEMQGRAVQLRTWRRPWRRQLCLL